MNIALGRCFNSTNVRNAIRFAWFRLNLAVKFLAFAAPSPIV